MLPNELFCLLILLCVSPLLYWLLWTRPKSADSAILSVPYRDQSLSQELSLLSVWESVCAPCRSATWKCDIDPRCGPCESFLYFLWFEFSAIRWLCSHDRALYMKNSNFSFPSWTNHLHMVASSLNRSGWLFWWLCKASLRLSYRDFFFWHCSWSPHNQDHRPE